MIATGNITSYKMSINHLAELISYLQSKFTSTSTSISTSGTNPPPPPWPPYCPPEARVRPKRITNTDYALLCTVYGD